MRRAIVLLAVIDFSLEIDLGRNARGHRPDELLSGGARLTGADSGQ
jgi:hypothetical protein